MIGEKKNANQTKKVINTRPVSDFEWWSLLIFGGQETYISYANGFVFFPCRRTISSKANRMNTPIQYVFVLQFFLFALITFCHSADIRYSRDKYDFSINTKKKPA